MEKYPKIQTVFKRDMSNKGRIIEDHYSLPEFEYLKDNKWIFTEKVDGTNIRIEWHSGLGVKFGGRTDNASIPTFLFKMLQEKFTSHLFDSTISETDHLCLYGEGFGAKIQKGGGNYKSDGVDFVLFDVLVDEWWLKREDVAEVAHNLGIEVVPKIGTGTLHEGIELVRNGIKSYWGDFNAEGLVMKPEIELKTRAGNRIITKIKHKDFI